MQFLIKLYHKLPSGIKTQVRNTYTSMVRMYHSGKYHIQLNKGTSFWAAFHHLPEYREAHGFTHYEPEFLEAFTKQTKKAKVIYDIGSNIGLYSLTAAALNKDARIIAFEPETHCCEIIEKSKNLNSFDNIEVQECCLGDHNDTIKLSMKGSTGHFVSHDVKEEEVIEKPVYRLDYLVEKKSIPAPDMVKIDVEGYEAHVMRGMKNIMSVHKPVILLELHKEFMSQYGENSNKLLDSAKASGYTVKVLRMPSPEKKGGHKQTHILLQPN